MKKAMFVAVAAIAITVHGAINVTASRDYVDKKVYTLQTNLEERIENAQPGNYSVVSNNAMNALQKTGGTIKGTNSVPFAISGYDNEAEFHTLAFDIYSGRWAFKHSASNFDMFIPYYAYLPNKTGTIAFVDDVSGAFGGATNYTDNATNNLAAVAHSGSYGDLSDKPTKLSQFQNDSGFITASTAPVKTVNSKTGNVTLGATDVGAIPQTGMVVNVTSGTMHFKTRLSVGSWPESYKPIQIPSGGGIGFAFGDGVRVESDVSMALGTGALATNGYVFVWNGDDDRYYSPVPSISNPYASRYRGGFYVNPKIRAGTTNPLQNFWIGDTTLNDWIGILAPAPDLSGYLPKTGGDMTGPLSVDTTQGVYRVQLGPPPGFVGGDGIWWTDNAGHSFSGGCGIYCVSLMGNLVIISEGNEIYLPNRPGTLALLSDVYTAIQQIAPDFTAKAYALNSLCTYDGVVYRCKDAYTATASSAKPNNDTTHWEAKKVSELFLPSTGGEITGDITFGTGMTKILSDPSGLRIFDFDGSRAWSFYENGENTVTRRGDLAPFATLVSPAFTGAPTAPTPTAQSIDTQVANKKYVDDTISADIPPAVSNVVTTALVRERLGVYLYIGEDGGVYVHTPTNEEEEQ